MPQPTRLIESGTSKLSQSVSLPMTSGLPKLSIIPSLQRYEAMGSGEWRYIDLGASKGFTAVLTSDDQGAGAPL
jgi:hypothetical protein